MKKLLLSALFVGSVFAAQAQLVPAKSPLAKVHQTVGLTNIEIEYSRPSLRGRSFMGEIVEPNALWRTGANMATKITFDQEIYFAGNAVSAGEYAIFTIPGEKEFVFILNSDANQGGTGNYDKTKNVLEMKVKRESSGVMIESMRFTFEELTNETAMLVWAWEKSKFTVPIKVNTQKIAIMNIEEEIADIQGRYSFYNQAANYYLDANIDKAQALAWAQESVALAEKFWNTHTLAKAYLANGDKKNARKVAQQSMKLSKEADYQAYVNLNSALLKEIENK